MKKAEWENGTWGTGPDDKVNAYYKIFDQHKDQSWLIVDWDKALDHYDVTRTVNRVNSSAYEVKEDTSAAYLQLDWHTSLFGKTLRGNAGVRGYETELTTSGFMNVPDKANPGKTKSVPAVSQQTYSGTLPAFNAVLEISDNFQIRAAAAQNINRPSLAAYAMNGSVSVDNGYVKVSTGNPNLNPYTSDEFDLSGEWYFGRVGMLTAGVFHKSIDGLVVSRTDYDVSYASTGLQEGLYEGVTATTNVDEYVRSVNLNSAKLNGLELSAQTDFFFLPAPFNNLGVVANATFIDSETMNVVNGKAVKSSIYGMSDVNHNITLYYETSTWGARVSSNFRSDYTIDSVGFNSTQYVDAAAFYQVTPKIRLTIDAINLTDEREEQYNSFNNGFGEAGARRLWNSTTSGRTVFVGANLHF